MSAAFIKLGELRNAILVSATIVYILGYLVWAFHAWESQLGPLPLIDSQYFIAGFLPALVLAVVFWTIANTRRFVDVTSAFLNPKRGGWRLKLSNAVTVIFYASVVVFVAADKIGDWESVSEADRALAGRVFTIAVFVSLFSLFLYPRTPFPDRYYRYIIIVYLIFVGLAAGTYVSIAIPGWLPQEFGGTRARCGVIAVAQSDLPLALSPDIFPKTGRRAETRTAVVQSDRLNFLYTGNRLLFRLPGDDSKTYELPANIVKGITWFSC